MRLEFIENNAIKKRETVRLVQSNSSTKLNMLIELGFDEEKAGWEAASIIFPGFGTYLRESQADTVLALLAQVKSK